jgi:hypothetical protein
LGLATNAGLGWIVIFCLGGIGIQYGVAKALGDKLPGPGFKPKQPEPSQPPPPAAAVPAGQSGQEAASVAPPALAPELEVQAAGAALLTTPAPPPSALLVTPSDEWFRVHDGFLIGRGSACDLRLQERVVSRRHATIRHAQGRWFIQDQGSTHGTYVNGQRVEAMALNPDDRITIGNTRFEFRTG